MAASHTLASLAALDAADAPPKVMRLEVPAAARPAAAANPATPPAAHAPPAPPAPASSGALPPLSQATIHLRTSLASAMPLEVRKPLPADGTLIVLQSGQLECFLHSGGSTALPVMELALRCEHGMWIVIERIVKPGGVVLVLNVQPLAVVMATQPTPNQLDLEPSKFALTQLRAEGAPADVAQTLTYTPRIVYDTTRDEAFLLLTLQAAPAAAASA